MFKYNNILKVYYERKAVTYIKSQIGYNARS